MKLDDLARRAADEVREASRGARFTVRAPGSRPLWARPATALAAAVVVLAVGLPLLILKGPWSRTVLEPGPITTTTAATSTTSTTTTEVSTTLAAGKTPAATVDELVAAVYAAINAKDSDAVWALTTDDAPHPIYYASVTVGHISDNLLPGYDFASSPLQGVEVLGEPVVSGDVVAVPVAYTFPADVAGVVTGFDLMVIRHVEGGLLVEGAATLYGDNRPDLVPDPADAWALIEASASAFNAGDVEGVLALMGENAALWEDVTDVDAIYRGTDLSEFLSAKVWGFTVGFTGEPVVSGRFLAVPSRHTNTANGVAYDGLYVFWISDGKIALQAYAQGE